jgi:hypothetical protein
MRINRHAPALCTALPLRIAYGRLRAYRSDDSGCDDQFNAVRRVPDADQGHANLRRSGLLIAVVSHARERPSEVTGHKKESNESYSNGS